MCLLKVGCLILSLVISSILALNLKPNLPLKVGVQKTSNLTNFWVRICFEQQCELVAFSIADKIIWYRHSSNFLMFSSESSENENSVSK